MFNFADGSRGLQYNETVISNHYSNTIYSHFTLVFFFYIDFKPGDYGHSLL